MRHLGGRGQFSYPSIRGASGQQLQIVWDDIPLTILNSSEGELPSIGLSALKSIDIYRGIAPVELAPTAIGGTIHLQSKTSDASDAGAATVSAGSFGYYGAGAWQKIRKNNWAALASWDWMTSENDFEHENERNSFNNPNEKSTEKRLNNGSDHQLGLLKLNYSGFKDWSPILLLQYQNKRRELPGLYNIPNNNAFFETEDWRQGVSLEYRNTKYGNSKVIFANYQQTEIFDDQGDDIGLGRQKDKYSTNGQLLKFNHNLEYGHASYIATASIQQEKTESKDDLRTEDAIRNLCLRGDSCPAEFDRQQLHIGGRATWNFNRNLRINGQISRIKLKDEHKPLYGLAGKKKNDSYTTSDVGFEYFLTEPLSISAIYSNQIRPATTRELFGDRGFTLGNEDLLPESSRGFDITTRCSGSSGSLALSLYERIIKDTIVGSADGRGVIKYENIGETEHQGIELNYSLDIIQNLTLGGNVGWHRQRISEHDRQSFIDKVIPNQRTWDISNSLSYKYDSWNTSLEYLRQTGGYYEISNGNPIPVRSQVNIRLAYSQHNYAVTLETNNLTNNRVSDFDRYPVPGRNYSTKITVKW
ncbi:hypothetical protein A3759_16085 [Thalassolituus sp. HI0120]|nr:hypothetical protein A3759_16085 [Thalassolituus sp. HI0120]